MSFRRPRIDIDDEPTIPGNKSGGVCSKAAQDTNQANHAWWSAQQGRGGDHGLPLQPPLWPNLLYGTRPQGFPGQEHGIGGSGQRRHRRRGHRGHSAARAKPCCGGRRQTVNGLLFWGRQCAVNVALYLWPRNYAVMLSLQKDCAR